MPEQPVRARLDASGHQFVGVTVHGGYQPDSIRAVAGLPLRVVFRRQDGDACSERVIFSAPRLDRRLAVTGKTTIDLPAQPPGEIRFTCGMGRYRGRIEFVDELRPSILSRARGTAAHLDAPLGRALVLWISSLPVIALVAIPAFNATAAFAAAGVALVAWVAGCLWVSRRSTQAT